MFQDVKACFNVKHANEEHHAKMAVFENETERKRKEHEIEMEIYNKIFEKLLNEKMCV